MLQTVDKKAHLLLPEHNFFAKLRALLYELRIFNILFALTEEMHGLYGIDSDFTLC